MARAGLAYAAMLAASVSAGALGYAVIWAYTPDEPAALAPSVSAALAPSAEVAAQAGPPGIVAPVVAAPHAASEPVTASAHAIAAAPAEPLAPPVASDIPVPRAGAAPVVPTRSQPAEVVVVRGRPSDVVRQSIEAAPRTVRVPAAVALAAPPAEAPVVRSAPAASHPITPREHAPVGSTTRPAPWAAPKPSAPSRLAALPPAHEAPAVASDAPQILIVRGGLRRATSVRPRRLAAAPAPDTAAPDTRITVLRGGAFRSAHTALLPPVRQPAVAVVRGAKPAAPALAGLAPGPLVLRIRD
jgi:hypothetical protein